MFSSSRCCCTFRLNLDLHCGSLVLWVTLPAVVSSFFSLPVWLLIWGFLDIILVHFTFLDSMWLLAVLGEECWGRTCLHAHKRKKKKELVTNQNNTKWLVSHPVLVSQMTFQFSASFTSWIVTPVSTFLNHTHVETHTKRNQCVTSC